MRLRFGRLSEEETRAKDLVCRKAHAAWRELRAGHVDSACQLMNAIDSRVELSLSELAGVRCAEVSAFDASAWPLAELMLANAPSDVGCVLSLGRSAVPLAVAVEEVKATHQLDLSRATLRAGFGRGHLLELTLGVPGGVGSENEQNAAENLVRAVVGDRVFETWVGAVHVVPAPRFPSLRVLDVTAPRTSLHVTELFDTVSAATRGVLAGLSESPLGVMVPAAPGVDASHTSPNRRGEWTMLEMEPLSNERATRKDDLILASTSTPELLRCYLDGAPCASRRFSSRETFVYVSYADTDRTMAARLARRGVIESALDACLSGVGAVTGVGFGVKTSYVDLGLHDLEAGLERVQSALRELDVPADTFIQFFDSELAEEWLAIWPDSRLSDA